MTILDDILPETRKEGRLTSLELMRHLVSYYRRYSIARRRPGDEAPGIRPQEGDHA